jgi:hypothetical protein
MHPFQSFGLGFHFPHHVIKSSSTSCGVMSCKLTLTTLPYLLSEHTAGQQVMDCLVFLSTQPVGRPALIMDDKPYKELRPWRRPSFPNAPTRLRGHMSSKESLLGLV